MENQKLQKSSKIFIAVIATFMLVISAVLSVVLNISGNVQVCDEPVLTMEAEILNIREYKEGEELLSDEILSGKEQVEEQEGEGEDKNVNRIAGKSIRRSTSDTPEIEYIKASDVLTMYLKGVDDTEYKSNSLTEENIEVWVDNVKQNGVQKQLNLVSESPANGVKYRLALTNITGNGELSIKIAPNTLEDAVGNKNVQKVQAVFGVSDNNTTKRIIVDNVKPTVAISADKSSPTSASIVTYTFTFSEPVYDFTADDITVDYGTKGEFAGSGDTYTLVVTNDGTCTQYVRVLADVCRDIAYNKNASSSVFMISIDQTSPKAIITGQATSVTDGLVRYYDATNNMGNGHSNNTTSWVDLSGNQTQYTVNNVNNVTFSDEGYANFNGTDSWVNLGRCDLTSAVTVEAEITLKEVQSGTKYILSNDEGGGYGLRLINGSPEFEVYINGIGWQRLSLNGVLDINRTYHIAGTYDGTTIKLYVDGMEQASTTVSGTIKAPNSSTVLALGANPSGNSSEGSNSNINVYSARVYNKALSQAEIRQNMNADKIRANTLESTASLSTNDDSVTLTIKFNENIQTLNAEAIKVTNGTQGALTKISDNEYTLAITNIQSNAMLTVEIDGTKYQDVAGNYGTSYIINRYRDTTGINTTITSSADDLSSTDSITYTITFDKPTTGFSADDIQVVGGTKGTFTSIDSRTYTLVVISDGSLTQTVSVPAGACSDGKGNLNTATSETLTAYLITYKVGNSTYNERIIKAGNAIGTLPSNPTKTGYSFNGWFTENNGQGTRVTIATIPTGNVTYFAYFTPNTYTVSFNANGGVGGQSGAVTATYDAPMPAISTTAPTKSNYTFMGWYNNANYRQGTQYYTASGASATNWNIAENTTLYAGWRDNQKPSVSVVKLDSVTFASQYQKLRFRITVSDNEMVQSVSFDTDDFTVRVGGTIVSATKSFEGDPTDLNDGKNGKVYVLDIENIQGNGELIIDVSGNKVVDAAGNKNMILHSTTNVWIDNNVPIVTADSELNGSSVSFTATDIAPVGDHAPSGVNGYQITDNDIEPTDGWTSVTVPAATTVDGKKQTSSTISLTNTGLVAGTHYIWVTDSVGNKACKQINIKYTITFNMGSSSTTITASGSTLPNVAVPSKTGYRFGGYYTGNNGTGIQYYNESGRPVRSNNFTQDKVLYAKWIKNTYTVHFIKNADDVLGTMADLNVSYGDSQTLETSKFVKIGKVFKSWNTKANGTGTTIADGATISNLTSFANTTVNLYAQWEDANAIFEKGTNFNVAAKILSGVSNSTSETVNTAIKKFKYAGIGDDEGQITLDEFYNIRANAIEYNQTTSTSSYVKISTSSSNAPIYIWYNSGTIYWFSLDSSPKLNQSCWRMFRGLKELTEIEQLKVLEPGETRTTSFDASSLTDLRAMFYGCEKLESLDLSGFNTSSATDIGSIFMNCKKLKSLDLRNWVTTNITSMDGLFANCEGLESLDLSSFNTSNVTDMNRMFSNCANLTQLNISSFNTSKVTTMSAMFQQCSKLDSLNLSNFNTAKVTTMRGMFYGCTELTELDLSSFNTSKVESMYFMFADCSNLETIYVSTAFVTTALNNEVIDNSSGTHTNSTELFKGCNSLKGGAGSSISQYSIDSVSARIDGRGGHGFFTNHFYIEFNANNVRTTGEMDIQGVPFGYGTAINANGFTATGSTFTGWNTSPDGTGTSFTPGQVLNYSLSQIKTIAQDNSNDKYVKLTLYAQWTNASAVFKSGQDVNTKMKKLAGTSDATYTTINTSIRHITRATSIPSTKRTSNYEVSTSTSTTKIYMWADASADNTIYWYSDDTNPKLNADASYMFYGLKGLTDITGLRDINTSETTNMSNMFEGCIALTALDVTYFETGNVTNMDSMFSNVSTITSLTLGYGFDTSKVTSMYRMFYKCSALTSISLGPKFYAQNVTNFEEMFREDTALGSLNLSALDTSSATNMKYMFYSDSSLTYVYIGKNFKANNVTNFEAMFGACSSLTSLDLTSFDTSSANSSTNFKYMFKDCTALTTIFASDKFVTTSVTSSNSNKMFENCTALVGGKGTSYSSSIIDKTRAKIDGVSGAGYFTYHYYITYNKNGGTGSMAEQAIPYGVATNLSTNTFTKSGSFFSCWNTKADGTGISFGAGNSMNYDENSIRDISTSSNSKGPVVTLYAQWDVNNFLNTTTNKSYSTLTEAFEEIQNNQTIQVRNNTTEPSDLRPEINANINATLDLNGKTVTLVKSLTNYGTLTVKTTQTNGTLTDTSTRYPTIKNNEGAQLNIQSGTINGDSASAIVNYGTTTVTGGNINENIGYAIVNYPNASCTISGGTVQQTYNDGNLTLSGGRIQHSSNSGVSCIVLNSRNMTVSGGSIFGVNKCGIQQNSNNAVLNITNGTIEGTYGIMADGKSTINISGTGTSVTSRTYEAIRALYSDVVITAGNIIGATDGITVSASGDNIGTVTLLGGTVRGEQNGVRISSNAILTMGENDGTVQASSSIVVLSSANSGLYYGVYQESNNAIFNFYDGEVIGQDGKSIKLNPTDLADNYMVAKSTTNSIETAVLGKAMLVTANLNGGHVSDSSGWISHGQGSTLFKTCIQNTAYGNLPVLMSRDGYTFEGWKVYGTDNYITSSSTVTSGENHTIVAMWSPIGTQIVFDANGGSGGQQNSVTAYYGSEMPTITTTPPTKEGYTFMGWYDFATTSAGTKYYNADGTSARTWDQGTRFTMLTAKWQEN